MEKINGLKTYITAVGMIVYGIYLISEGDQDRGVELILAGLGFSGLRHAIK